MHLTLQKPPIPVAALSVKFLPILEAASSEPFSLPLTDHPTDC